MVMSCGDVLWRLLGWSCRMDMALVPRREDLQRLMDRLTNPANMGHEPLTIEECRLLIGAARTQYRAKPRALIDAPAPVVICGDTHGQYRDAVRIFHFLGWPNDQSYLFLGDYVDRGSRNLETICLMLILKVCYRKKFFLLRGNHETEEINKHYGFLAECKARFGDGPGEKLWKEFNNLFNYMPLAALVNNRIFCMHGGIPRTRMDRNFTELRQTPIPLDRIRGNEIAADLLWSDPNDDVDEFVENPRGLGHQFGVDQVREFLHDHDLDLIVRAHQVFPTGFKMMPHDDRWPPSRTPLVITVFSAPNYGGQFKNCAAALEVGENLTLNMAQIKGYDRQR